MSLLGRDRFARGYTADLNFEQLCKTRFVKGLNHGRKATLRQNSCGRFWLTKTVEVHVAILSFVVCLTSSCRAPASALRGRKGFHTVLPSDSTSCALGSCLWKRKAPLAVRVSIMAAPGGSCGTPSRRKLDLMFHVAEYLCIDGVADTYPRST